MELARLWKEHLDAGCPSELSGFEIAGVDAVALDAEITACVSAMITRRLIPDERMAHRLEEVSHALVRASTEQAEPVSGYAQRLNRLVSAVLIETRTGRA